MVFLFLFILLKLFFSLPIDEEKLISIFNSAIGEFVSSGDYSNHWIKYITFCPGIPSCIGDYPSLSSSEIASLGSYTFKVGFYDVYAPYIIDFGLSSPGFDVDLIEYIMTSMGHRYSISINYTWVDLCCGKGYFEALQTGINTGEIDFFIAAMDITEDREQLIEFSCPTTIAGKKLIRSPLDISQNYTTQAEINQNFIKFVQIQETAMIETIETYFPEVTIIQVAGQSEMFDALLNKEAHFALEDEIVLGDFLVNDCPDQCKIQSLPSPISIDDKYNLGIGFKKIQENIVNNDSKSGLKWYTVVLFLFAFFLTMTITILTFIVLILLLILFSVAVFFFYSRKQHQRISYFRQLKDFNVLLQEQKAREDSELPYFEIKKELFEIDYDSLRLIKQLGVGGSGAVVYLATWNHSKVAFKVFKTEFLNNQHNFMEFEREVSIMSSISCPHVLRFYGASLKLPRVGIVMELAENGSLSEYISIMNHNRTKMEMKERLRICLEVVYGMIYLNERNVIHRDLKCDNVLLDRKLFSKICDFGCAKVLKDAGSNTGTRIVGTNNYMAPEIVLGKNNYDSKCDVFSFSIIMWELYYHKMDPYSNFEGNVEMSVAQNEHFRPVLSFSEASENHFTWYIELMQKCWNADPGKRPDWMMIKRTFEENSKDTGSRIEQLKQEEIEEKNEMENLEKKFEKEEKQLKKKIDSKEIEEEKVVEMLLKYKRKVFDAESKLKENKAEIRFLRESNSELVKEMENMKRQSRIYKLSTKKKETSSSSKNKKNNITKPLLSDF